MKNFKLPRIGMRIVKTSIAVFICLIIFILRGDHTTAFYACVAALLCMQPDFDDSIKVAANRTVGTLIGGLLGTVTLLARHRFFSEYDKIFYYLLVALLVIPLIYTTVIIKMPSSTTIACTVFLVIATTNSDMNAFLYSLNRVADTVIGILVSLVVNMFHLPKFNQKAFLFICELEKVLFNDEGKLTATSSIKLRQLISRGAQITFYSGKTPAMFLDKIKDVNFNLPAIVMNGAALYDMRSRSYSDLSCIRRESYDKVWEIVKSYATMPFVHSVKNDVMYIFYDEFTNDIQRDIYLERRSLPEKQYVYGEMPKNYDAIMLSIADTNEVISLIAENISGVEGIDFKRFTLEEEGREGYSFLEIFSSEISIEKAVSRIKKLTEAEIVYTFSRGEVEELLESADKSYIVGKSKKTKHIVQETVKVADAEEPVLEDANEEAKAVNTLNAVNTVSEAKAAKPVVNIVDNNNDNVVRKIGRIYNFNAN